MPIYYNTGKRTTVRIPWPIFIIFAPFALAFAVLFGVAALCYMVGGVVLWLGSMVVDAVLYIAHAIKHDLKSGDW